MGEGGLIFLCWRGVCVCYIIHNKKCRLVGVGGGAGWVEKGCPNRVENAFEFYSFFEFSFF
jgi:hypothetical protein